MVFNSLEFLVFFVFLFFLYWIGLKEKTKVQNWLLLIASYFFYGYASWKMLPLLLVATAIFYGLGISISKAKSEKQAGRLTTLGVIFGIGLLVYFKYLNFFIDEFATLLSYCGLHSNIHSFGILMPLGISFFTFKLISYVVEINRGKIEPTHDFVVFATYISFFPCILSGPIDRPIFIRQLQTKRIFDYNQAVDGCRQILWGLFKKVVVADNCTTYVDAVWSDIPNQSGSTLVLAMVLYSFQLYADFSGYSDMAIGVGKLLGFSITPNFKTPFFAVNMKEFWQRWHISLTSWLSDYVFTPLNIKFRDLGKLGVILAILINMLLVGFWHGANWTYGVFGLYHGLLFVPLILTSAFIKKPKLKTYDKVDLPIPKDFGRMVLTFALVCIGQMIFRCESVEQIGNLICGICDLSLMSMPWLMTRHFYIPIAFAIMFMLAIEWIHRKEQHGLTMSLLKKPWIRIIFGYLLLCVIIWNGHFGMNQFIYFNF